MDKNSKRRVTLLFPEPHFRDADPQADNCDLREIANDPVCALLSFNGKLREDLVILFLLVSLTCAFPSDKRNKMKDKWKDNPRKEDDKEDDAENDDARTGTGICGTNGTLVLQVNTNTISTAAHHTSAKSASI